MANFRKVGNGSFKYVKYAECEEGQVLATGTYLGPRQGTYGVQHQIREDNGDVTVLNSSGHLNFLLENEITKGDYIQVVYKGTELLKKGKFKGKEMHQFEVFIDEDRERDVNARPVDTSASAASDDEDEEIEEMEEEDKEPVQKKSTKRVAVDDEDDEVEQEVVAKAATAKKKLSQDELLARYRNKA